MPNEQNPNITPEGENYGLPENFVPVDAPPIIPVNIGASQNPYLSGSIPSNLNLQPDLIATDIRGGRVPTVRSDAGAGESGGECANAKHRGKCDREYSGYACDTCDVCFGWFDTP